MLNRERIGAAIFDWSVNGAIEMRVYCNLQTNSGSAHPGVQGKRILWGPGEPGNTWSSPFYPCGVPSEECGLLTHERICELLRIMTVATCRSCSIRTNIPLRILYTPQSDRAIIQPKSDKFGLWSSGGCTAQASSILVAALQTNQLGCNRFVAHFAAVDANSMRTFYF